MTTPTDALAITRPLLRVLQWLNGGYALLVFGLLVFSLANPGLTHRALGVQPGDGHDDLVLALRAIVVLGLVAAALVHVFLRHLRAIVATVGSGDPFVAENARRLRALAWLVFAGEAVRMVIGAIIWKVSSPDWPIDANIEFSFAPWLAVLLLFVLAQVFADGARMRADLEGTV